MRKLCTACAAAALLAALVAGAARPQSATPLLGFVAIGQESWKLAPLDPLTLAPRPGSSVRVGSRISAWSFSPDRSKLVLGGYDASGKLLLVDTRAMHGLGLVDTGGTLQMLTTFWPEDRRLYAVVTRLDRRDDGTYMRRPSAIVTVDPSSRTVLGERSLDGYVYGWAHGAGVLALVLGQESGVGPAQLVVVGSDGSVKTVGLPGVQVGYDPVDESAPQAVTHYAQPGLAVASDASRAFVASPGVLTAVDLRTFEVSSHPLGSSRRLQRVEKGVPDGSARFVVWARDGELLVTGREDRAVAGATGAARYESHPTGLQLVNTKDWSTRMVDATAGYATVGADAILAMGFAWDAKQHRTVGLGATIYGLGGAKRARIFGRQNVYGVVVGRRAFVVGRDIGYTIVSTTTGRILRKFRHQLPQPLLAAAQDN